MEMKTEEFFKLIDQGICPRCKKKMELRGSYNDCLNCFLSYNNTDKYAHVDHKRIYRDGKIVTDLENELRIFKMIEWDFILQGLTDRFDWIRDRRDEALEFT